MVIEDSPASADHRLAITPRVPSYAEPGGDVVEVTRNPLRDAELVLRRCRKCVHRLELRCEFCVVTEAEIHRQAWHRAPRILPVQAHGVVGKRIMRIPDALHEDLRQTKSVRLDRAEGRRT